MRTYTDLEWVHRIIALFGVHSVAHSRPHTASPAHSLLRTRFGYPTGSQRGALCVRVKRFLYTQTHRGEHVTQQRRTYTQYSAM